MFLKETCINFYISAELLHFDLHNFSKCVNNACMKCAENKFDTGRRHCRFVSHCLISLCWSVKIIFPSLSWDKTETFHVYISRNHVVSVLAALKGFYISQYETFGLWHASGKGRCRSLWKILWKNPSMRICIHSIIRRTDCRAPAHLGKMAALIRHLYFIICSQKMIGTFFRKYFEKPSCSL